MKILKYKYILSAALLSTMLGGYLLCERSGYGSIG